MIVVDRSRRELDVVVRQEDVASLQILVGGESCDGKTVQIAGATNIKRGEVGLAKVVLLGVGRPSSQQIQPEVVRLMRCHSD